jgi:hypothetical protein
VDPVPDSLLLGKSGNAGNRTGTCGSVARYSDHRGCRLEPMGILFIIYIICSICSPRHYAFSQQLYDVCANFAQHIGMDGSKTVCNSLPKVTKISDFNSIHHP